MSNTIIFTDKNNDIASYEVPVGTTLSTFLRKIIIINNPIAVLVNGEARPANFELLNFSVIEPSTVGFEISPESATSAMVNIYLSDYRGFSGDKEVSSTLDDLLSQYDKDFQYSIYRDAQEVTDSVSELQNGDRVILVWKAGIKGGQK
jgi:sulfur carrier protein ThiS